MNHLLANNLAIEYRNAANTLYIKMNDKLKEGNSSELKGTPEEFLGLMASSVLLYSLSIEISLKALISITNGKYKWGREGHSHEKLFKELPEDMRSTIQKTFSKMLIDISKEKSITFTSNIDDILKKTNNTFIDVRYLYEDLTKFQIDFRDIIHLSTFLTGFYDMCFTNALSSSQNISKISNLQTVNG